jgi:hypothetical protein
VFGLVISWFVLAANLCSWDGTNLLTDATNMGIAEIQQSGEKTSANNSSIESSQATLSSDLWRDVIHDRLDARISAATTGEKTGKIEAVDSAKNNSGAAKAEGDSCSAANSKCWTGSLPLDADELYRAPSGNSHDTLNRITRDSYTSRSHEPLLQIKPITTEQAHAVDTMTRLNNMVSELPFGELRTNLQRDLWSETLPGGIRVK